MTDATSWFAVLTMSGVALAAGIPVIIGHLRLKQKIRDAKKSAQEAAKPEATESASLFGDAPMVLIDRPLFPVARMYPTIWSPSSNPLRSKGGSYGDKTTRSSKGVAGFTEDEPLENPDPKSASSSS